jgi:hypothetical protein
MTTTKAPLAWTNGNVTVRLSHLESGVWHVETTSTSGFVLDQWSKSWQTEDMARYAATHVANAFRTYGTAHAIERLRDEMVAVLAKQDRRTARHMHDPEVVAEATAILDSIADLDGLALIVSLRAELAA